MKLIVARALCAADFHLHTFSCLAKCSNEWASVCQRCLFHVLIGIVSELSVELRALTWLLLVLISTGTS